MVHLPKCNFNSHVEAVEVLKNTISKPKPCGVEAREVAAF